ncbi:two-component system response regulator CreB [Lysobacter sp. TY2-98]|uniref:two-component system response regulator CreB n=1 Tax=Lysobacter sp. TY2-98 TaxID=2290922 RepID=UPI000E20353B|nr:two-component system response regulator CreB [Lysobacter sp. TY2-98]AXK72355.1 two-component system response regulator CreB [Lysobacter sp. TY2-98]
MGRILLVEDESAIARTVEFALREEGFEVEHALTGGDALQLAAAGMHDLAILDVGLPDIGGFALCRELRRHAPALPVIFLTARDAEADRVLGFEIGADDYVAKPFSPRELAARVRAVLRRSRGAAPTGTFVHDAEGHRIAWRGRALDLTRYEYGLLAALLQRPGAILSRAQLMDRVWGMDSDSTDRTVDTHIKTLRAKLRDIDPDADPIRTQRGLGYSLYVD